MTNLESNPEILASDLDEHLDHDVELIIYGRSAIALGFDNPPSETLKTLDIDAIVRMESLKEFEADDNFWEAKEKVNEKFEDKGLYITHIFAEEQVFLRRNWSQYIVPVTRPPTNHLKLFRPATIDLVLTKMMRGDDQQDMDDAAFLIRHDRISTRQLEEAFQIAHLTDVVELHDAFERAKPIVLCVAREFDE